MSARLTRICRYAVKGMSPEPLTRVVLAPGKCLPGDRRFALARSATEFDPRHPEWLPKTKFVMLMREERLAQLQTRFDPTSGDLTIQQNGRQVLGANITENAGRESANRFFAAFLGDAVDGAPRLVEAPGHTFSDAERRPNSSTYQYVSIVNLASLRSLEQAVQAPLDPIRFRANLYIDGAPAWAEFDWVESVLIAGGVRLHVVSRITRCAATSVNPATAVRDVNVPAMLREAFGHGDMGVYAEVIAGGEVAVGDSVAPERAEPTQTRG